MKTLKNIINEGFFSNVGNDQAIARDQVMMFLDRVQKDTTHYQSWEAKKLYTQFINNPELKTINIESSSVVLTVTPEILGEDPVKLPYWFVITGKPSGLKLCITGFKNLSTLEGIPNGLQKLEVVDCPKLVTMQGFPQSIGSGGFRFLPDETTTYLYKDIIKKIRDIKGPILIHKTKLEFDDPKKKLPTMKSVKSSAPRKETPDVIYAKERNVSFGQIPPAMDEQHIDSAPTWTIDRENGYVILDQHEDIIGFTNKKLTTIYRKGPTGRIMTIADDVKNQIMYGVNKTGGTVCKLVWKTN